MASFHFFSVHISNLIMIFTLASCCYESLVVMWIAGSNTFLTAVLYYKYCVLIMISYYYIIMNVKIVQYCALP